jgi:hypothetical protein
MDGLSVAIELEATDLVHAGAEVGHVGVSRVRPILLRPIGEQVEVIINVLVQLDDVIARLGKLDLHEVSVKLRCDVLRARSYAHVFRRFSQHLNLYRRRTVHVEVSESHGNALHGMRPLLKLLFGSHLGTVDVGRLPVDGDAEAIARGVPFRRRVHGRRPRRRRHDCNSPSCNDQQKSDPNAIEYHAKSALCEEVAGKFDVSQRGGDPHANHVRSVRTGPAIAPIHSHAKCLLGVLQAPFEVNTLLLLEGILKLR